MMLKNRKYLWMCMMVIFSFLMLVWSTQVVKYFIWGVSAEANVTKTFPDRIRRDDRLVVEYTFIDTEGKQYHESDDVPTDWPVPGPKVKIEYIPGVENSSRLKGNSELFLNLAMALIPGLIAGFSGYEFYKLLQRSD